MIKNTSILNSLLSSHTFFFPFGDKINDFDFKDKKIIIRELMDITINYISVDLFRQDKNKKKKSDKGKNSSGKHPFSRM